jgi:hypothetical protein
MIVLPFNRTGPIKEVPFTEEEQLDAVNEIHSAFDAVTLKNCHSAVVGTGGTVRASTKVAIVRALKKSQGEGGTLFDVGCGFGHFMLAALKTGFSGACGCELPDNEVQRGVCYEAKARLGISPDDLCEWIGSDVTKLDLPEHLRRRITAVYSFWCGIGPEAQRRTLDLCRDTLVNVRSVAVYLAKGWTTPKHGMAAFKLNYIPSKLIVSFPTSSCGSQSRDLLTNLVALRNHQPHQCGFQREAHSMGPSQTSSSKLKVPATAFCA